LIHHFLSPQTNYINGEIHNFDKEWKARWVIEEHPGSDRGEKNESVDRQKVNYYAGSSEELLGKEARTVAPLISS
jgi:hypothetical protein